MLAFALAAVILGPGADIRTFDSVLFMGEDHWRIEGRAGEDPTTRQQEPSIAIGPAGFGIAWEKKGALEGLPGSLSRAFDRYGRPLEGERHVDSTRTFAQIQPAAVFAGERITAAFSSPYRDSSGNGVFFGGVSATRGTFGHQSEPVAAAANGRVVLAWVSDVTRDRRVVFARVFADDMTPIAPEFRVSSPFVGSDAVPSVAFSGGRVAIAWHRVSPKGSVLGVRSRMFSTDGKPLSDERVIDGGNSLEPSIAACGDGFVIAWNEMDDAGEVRIRARRFDAGLAPAGPVVSAPKFDGRQNAAAVAGKLDGSFVVAWNQRIGKDADVLLQAFSASGDYAGRAIHVSATRAGTQAMAEATGRTRLLVSDEGIVSLAWHGDAGLGHSAGAHFTVLVPKRVAPRGLVTELLETRRRTEELIADQVIERDEKRLRPFVAEATPHEPPKFDARQRDPWGGRGGGGKDGGGFLAIVNTGWTPPDPHHAVGPDHIVAIVNGQIAFFTKSGTNTFRDEIEGAQGFWGSLGTGGFVFDPEAVYDPLGGRFFAMACERTGGLSYFLLAVSDDSDPNGTWFKYRFNVTALAGGDIDSPNMATDATAVYLSADFFSGGQKYLIYMLSKADVMSGVPNPAFTSHLITGTQSHGIPITWDASAPAQYMIEHFESSSNTTVRLHAIRNALTSPTRTTFTLTVPTYGPPEDPPQAGTTTRPETFDSRFWSCVYRDGFLWATHHVHATKVRARWYQIAMNGWPASGNDPTLVQSGEVIPASGVRTFFSSISVDGVGNAAVVCARSSPSEFISMHRAIRRATDPVDTMPDQAILKSSTSAYTTARWGDYSGCVTDPVDNRTFWGHHEFAESNSWRTWIEPFQAQPNIAVVTPSSLSIGFGVQLSGGLAQLWASDDDYLVVREAPPLALGGPSITFEIQGILPTQDVLSFMFRLESHVTATPATAVTVRTEMFNVNSSLWEVVDVRAATASDNIVEITPAGDPKRFIDPWGKLTRARVSYYDPGTLFSFGWRARIDQAVWPIEY